MFLKDLFMSKYADNFWICSSVQTACSTAASRLSKCLLSLIRVPSESKSRCCSTDSSTRFYSRVEEEG